MVDSWSRAPARRLLTQSSSEFVASTVARISVRPAAIAYTIRPGDRDGLLKAVGYACTEWGGGGQPIVPVSRRGRVAPLYEQQIGLLRPEAVIDYAGLTSDEATELARRWRTEIIPERSLAHHEPGAPVGVTAEPILSHRTLIVPRARAALAATVALGTLIPSQLEAWRATGIDVAEVSGPAELLEAQVDKPSPVSATRWDFSAFESQGFYAPVIVYTDIRLSMSLAVYFWNMRAAGWANGHHVLWLPLPALEDDAIAARLRELARGRQLQSQPDLLLNGSPNADLDRLAQRIGFAPMPPETPAVRFEFGAAAREAAATRPLTYMVRKIPAMFVFGERKVGRQIPVQVTVSRPTTQVEFENPFDFRRPGGLVRVDIADDYFRWPDTPGTARLVEPNATWSPYGLTLTFQPSKRFRLSLGVPDVPDVVRAFLGDSGWRWEPSDKGRYASALVESLANVSRARVVSSDELAVVRALVSLSRRKAEQILRNALSNTTDGESVVAATATLLPALVPRWRTAGEIAGDLSQRKDFTVTVLDALVERRLVRRAFRHNCTRCGLESAIPLDRVDDYVSCEGCRTMNALRGPAGSEPLLVYALTTLMDRVMDQDCLGHVLVEDWARTNRGLVWSFPGANLLGQSPSQREVDVIGVSRVEVVIAEVKDRSTGFDEVTVREFSQLGAAVRAGRLLFASLDVWGDSDQQRTRDRAAASFKGTVETIDARQLLDWLPTSAPPSPFRL